MGAETNIYDVALVIFSYPLHYQLSEYASK